MKKLTLIEVSGLSEKLAQRYSPFSFQTVQSDHDSEFSTYFTEHLQKQGIAHRHSRVRKSSDSGHDECLNHLPRKLRVYQKEIPEYIHYYNTERPHLALGMKTPLEVFKVID